MESDAVEARGVVQHGTSQGWRGRFHLLVVPAELRGHAVLALAGGRRELRRHSDAITAVCMLAVSPAPSHRCRVTPLLSIALYCPALPLLRASCPVLPRFLSCLPSSLRVEERPLQQVVRHKLGQWDYRD